MTKTVQIGEIPDLKFVCVLNDGDEWRPHLSGNGIIVTNPSKQSRWYRFENNALIGDSIDPSDNTEAE